jgi:hypothetical protein
MGDLFDEYPEINGACFRYTSVGKVVKAIRCGAKSSEAIITVLTTLRH